MSIKETLKNKGACSWCGQPKQAQLPPPSFFQRCIRPFFFSKHSNYLKAPYFWASVMLLLTVCTIIKILCGYPEYTPLAGIETGLALGLIAVYNQGNKNANNLPK